MMVDRKLLTLLVRRRSQSAYYAAHEMYVAREKLELEQRLGKRFSQLTVGIRKSFERMWRRPWWGFNDIIGFVEIGLDSGGRMLGAVWVMRKHFPRGTPERAHSSLESPRDFVYAAEVRAFDFDKGTNQGWATACQRVIDESAQIIHQRRSLRHAELAAPHVPLEHIDFVSAFGSEGGT